MGKKRACAGPREGRVGKGRERKRPSAAVTVRQVAAVVGGLELSGSGHSKVASQWVTDFLVQYRGTCPSPVFSPPTDNSCPAWNGFLCQVVSQVILHLILTTSRCLCILMSIAQ